MHIRILYCITIALKGYTQYKPNIHTNINTTTLTSPRPRNINFEVLLRYQQKYDTLFCITFIKKAYNVIMHIHFKIKYRKININILPQH
jgi:hypothetical protein